MSESEAKAAFRRDLVDAVRQRSESFSVRSLAKEHGVSREYSEQVAEALFVRLFRKALEDRVVTEQEETRLSEIGELLELSEDRQKQLRSTTGKEELQNLVMKANADGRLDALERAAIAEMRVAVGLEQDPLSRSDSKEMTCAGSVEKLLGRLKETEEFAKVNRIASRKQSGAVALTLAGGALCLVALRNSGFFALAGIAAGCAAIYMGFRLRPAGDFTVIPPRRMELLQVFLRSLESLLEDDSELLMNLSFRSHTDDVFCTESERIREKGWVTSGLVEKQFVDPWLTLRGSLGDKMKFRIQFVEITDRTVRETTDDKGDHVEKTRDAVTSEAHVQLVSASPFTRQQRQRLSALNPQTPHWLHHEPLAVSKQRLDSLTHTSRSWKTAGFFRKEGSVWVGVIQELLCDSIDIVKRERRKP